MTDYRDLNHPGLDHARQDARRYAQQSNTSIGGILIALALIGVIFLGLSLFFGSSTDDRPQAPVIEQTTPQPVTPPASD